MSQRTLSASRNLPREPGSALARWVVAARWRLALAVVLSSLLAGCQTLSPHGSNAKGIAACRQYSQQGINAMERGDWSRAESLLAQAVDSCPVDSEARRNYAETLWHRGAAIDAVAQLEEARRVSAEDSSLAVRTGELYLMMRQGDSAQRLAEQALDMDPKSAPAWALRGRTFEARGQIREALADYQRSLSYAPANSDVLLRVAEAYRALRQPERALAVLETLSDTYPPGEEPQQIHYLAGLALAALGRHRDAAESLALARDRGQPNAEILCRLAEAELLSGRRAEAQATIVQALALEPDHMPSRALRERIDLANRGRSDRAAR